MSITDYIKEHKIRADIIDLETPFPTNKHIARYFNVPEKQIFVARLLQGENKRVVLCVYTSGTQLDFHKIEDLTGIKRLRYADREVAQKTTGFPAEVIPPIGFSDDLGILIDKHILEYETGYSMAGDMSLIMKINPKDIVKYSRGEIAEIVLN